MKPDVTGDEQQQAAHRRFARSAGLAAAATLTSRILGVVRESVVAAVFGAGNDIDAFNVAFRVPNLMRDLFAEGAMSAAFVPAFTRYLTQDGRKRAFALGRNVLTALLLVTGVIVALGMIFARPLVTAFAGDYAAVPGKLELTIQLTRIVLPFLSMVAVAAVLMGMLNSLHHYFVPSLAPAAFNVATILCALTLVPSMHALGWPGVTAIAVAVLVGGLGQLAVQWWPLRQEGFRYRPQIDTHDPDLKHVLLLMGPGTIGLAATQINLFVTTHLATTQGTGAVSWLMFAFRLMYLPIGLFGVSIATAMLPQAAGQAASGERTSLEQTVARALSMMLAVSIPAMFGLLVLATPIVKLLYEHGRFLPADTEATAAALRYYTIGVVGYSAVRIVSPVFYALGKNRIPVAVSMVSVAVNLMLSIVLVKSLGFRGLALSTSLAALTNASILILLLRGHLGGLGGRQLIATSVKALIAASAMAAVVLPVERAMVGILGVDGHLSQAIALTTAIASGLVVLGVSAKLLHVPEFDDVISAGRRQLEKVLRPGAGPQ